jgi:hypothetical protein
MSWLNKARRRRLAAGSTLIEVLIAGALLAIGMTAIAAMLNESVFSSRSATRKTEASELGVSTLERIVSAGFNQLTLGTFDGGRFIDDAGTVLYETQYTVTDGGMPINSVYVEVKVTYLENPGTSYLLKKRTQTYGTVVSSPNLEP